MSLDHTDDKSTLIQAMAWCRQATSHYLSQCWPRSVSPYGIIRPQWVNPMWQRVCIVHLVNFMWWNAVLNQLEYISSTCKFNYPGVTINIPDLHLHMMHIHHVHYSLPLILYGLIHSITKRKKTIYVIYRKFASYWHIEDMDKIADFFLQTTYSVMFSSMKMSQFCIQFLWNVFLGVQLMKGQHWLR